METIFTIGHATHPAEEFLRLLQMRGITLLADIRTIPRSRHNPQFNGDALPQFLKAHHIAYVHMKELGGLRHSRQDSPNKGWRNNSFRGYADYMQTEEFRAALEKLIGLGKEQRVAIMCAESVPWRCHRSLVGDALLLHHIDVQDIFPDGAVKPHRLTAFAQVNGEHITYPPAQPALL